MTPTTWLDTFQVNTGTAATGIQRLPQIIGLSNGDFVVAWQENAAGLPTPAGAVATAAGTDIVAKIYDAEGNVVRDSFRLNSDRSFDDELDFDITATRDGFAMTYIDDSIPNVNQTTVYFERFDFDGAPQTGAGTAFQIDNEAVAADFLRNPQIAANLLLTNDDVLVAYDEGIGTADIEVNGRVIDETGLVGVEFDVGSNAIGDNTLGDVAVLSNGNFVAVFQETDFVIGLEIVGIEFKIVSPSGAPLANADVTDTLLFSPDASEPQVASLEGGGFVVVWTEDSDILAHTYSNTGSSTSAEITIAGGANTQNEPAVTALPDGDFVVAWDDDTTGDLFAQRFNADGTTDGSQFTVENVGTTEIDISTTGDGRILFTWLEEGGEIFASIWDPRDSTIDTIDYTLSRAHILDSDVITTGLGDTTVHAFSDATVLGQGGDDTIIAGLTGGEYFGGDGNDLIIAGIAFQTLDGGTGIDTVDTTVSVGASEINLVTGMTNFADQFFFNFENLVTGTGVSTTVTGTSASNTITTGSGNDVLYGGLGADVLYGGVGNDVLNDGGGGVDQTFGGAGDDTHIVNFADFGETHDGGAGIDTVDFTNDNGSLQVIDLSAPSFSYFSATFSGFENVIDGLGDNTVISGTGANSMDGGGGTDTLSFQNSSAAVIVNIDINSLTGGDATGDTIANFENVTGSDFDDDIRASFGSSVLMGGAGNDALSGGLFADTLIGGNGDDRFIENADGVNASGEVFDGGAGFDTLSIFDTAGVNANLRDDTVFSVEELEFRQQAIISLNVLVTAAQMAGNFGAITVGGAALHAGSGTTFTVDVVMGGSTFLDLSGVSVNGFTEPGDGFILTGDADNETIIGSSVVDTILGDLGDDTIVAGAGNDTVEGGDGDDIISGGGGEDFISAGAGNDTVEGGDGDDIIFGRGGKDTLFGDAGNDTLDGNSGFVDTSILYGGIGDDTFLMTGVDFVSDFYGGAGFDTLDLSGSLAPGYDIDLTNGMIQDFAGGGPPIGAVFGIENIIGSPDPDSIIGSAANDTLAGGGDDDWIAGSLGADVIYGGLGEDTADYSGSAAGVEIRLSGATGSGGDATGDKLFDVENLLGSDFADDLIGNAVDNTLYGEGAVDSIIGAKGEDLIFGGDGNDRLRGNADSDVVYGGEGNDQLIGDGQADSLYGDGGNDRIFGGSDNDFIDGGGGDDSLFGTLGADEIHGGAGSDLLRGNDGSDILYGGEGDDDIGGNEFADDLFGGAGNDKIFGAQGIDALFGGDGNDTINGGVSSDELTGGAGNDIFEFTNTGGIDRIKDWQDGIDTLDFTAAGLGFGDFTVSTFGGGAGAKIVGGGFVVFFEGVPTTDIDALDFL